MVNVLQDALLMKHGVAHHAIVKQDIPESMVFAE